MAPQPASSSGLGLGRVDTNSSGRQINTSTQSVGKDSVAKKSSTTAVNKTEAVPKASSDVARKASTTSEPTKKVESVKAASATVHIDSREEQKTEELNKSKMNQVSSTSANQTEVTQNVQNIKKDAEAVDVTQSSGSVPQQ